MAEAGGAHDESTGDEIPGVLEEYKKTLQEVNSQLGVQVAAWLRKRGKVNSGRYLKEIHMNPCMSASCLVVPSPFCHPYGTHSVSMNP